MQNSENKAKNTFPSTTHRGISYPSGLDSLCETAINQSDSIFTAVQKMPKPTGKIIPDSLDVDYVGCYRSGSHTIEAHIPIFTSKNLCGITGIESMIFDICTHNPMAVSALVHCFPESVQKKALKLGTSWYKYFEDPLSWRIVAKDLITGGNERVGILELDTHEIVTSSIRIKDWLKTYVFWSADEAMVLAEILVHEKHHGEFWLRAIQYQEFADLIDGENIAEMVAKLSQVIEAKPAIIDLLSILHEKDDFAFNIFLNRTFFSRLSQLPTINDDLRKLLRSSVFHGCCETLAQIISQTLSLGFSATHHGQSTFHSYERLADYSPLSHTLPPAELIHEWEEFLTCEAAELPQKLNVVYTELLEKGLLRKLMNEAEKRVFK